ncbi:zinc finger BED domain-containing protein 4-like [Xyrauchen texanus]|uniref:zinc finger BED domain-containing protein 4-like n=1 Tax=Xyrauchen texanus TaxID=154827 RepID=UPI0022419918|nr:zinc finger BED domain-containing protein 4-like [Xyrauchen texanus]
MELLWSRTTRGIWMLLSESLGWPPHVRCFAHTLNLASQAGLSVPRVSCLLGRVRRIAAFFHRSSTATVALAAKQILMELPAHKLIIDVTTRWNSNLDMIKRYLEQQVAVTATLLSNNVRRNVHDIDTLDGSDIRDAEDMDEGKEGASGHPPAAEQPLDQTDRAGAELKQPPSKKTALEDLLGGTFDEPVAQHFSQIDAEINKCRAETSISLNSCLLKWWKKNARLYPLLSSIAKAYLSTPATSVPSERVFSSAGDIVNVQRSQLLPENVDMLIFLKKNM